MALLFPNLKAVSGDFTIATACSLPKFTAPLAGQNTEYLLEQDFMQNLKDFTELALNTQHPDFDEFVLTAEGPLQDVMGGKVKWTRTYAKPPATYTEPGGNLNYPVIGFESASGSIAVFGRNVMSKNLECQLTHEFFLVGAAELYTTWEAIPGIEAQLYLFDYHAIDPVYINTNFPTTFLTDSPPFSIATVPTRTDYEALIANDLADATSYSIVAENATIERWQGNIYRRTTRRVKAV